MKQLVLAGLLLTAGAAVTPAAPSRAHNVILFLADAAGIPTINAASRFGYDAPRRLFVQRMPFIGLSETSTALEWVSDSAAGMTAIVTGTRTNNGVIAQGPAAVRGVKDGPPLKTLLDYAEEHGLSTGIITNDSVAGATPASLYAHSNDRSRFADIIVQAFTPQYGNGVDVLIGPATVERAAVRQAGNELDAIAAAANRPLRRSLDEVPANSSRAFVFTDDGNFDLDRAVDLATGILSKNPNGFFLMVEWDAHTDRPEPGLRHVVELDRTIERLAGEKSAAETLLLFTADHSFDLRVRGGRTGSTLLEGLDPAAAKATPALQLPNLRVDDAHTGEEVLVAAQGPGADRVHGYLANTDLFRIMLDAWGWAASTH
jgi:alkaline phosphatase